MRDQKSKVKDQEVKKETFLMCLVRHLELEHKPRLGDHCYGNKWIVLSDKHFRNFELLYNPQGWESFSQISISLFSIQLILKLKFRIGFLSSLMEDQDSELNYTGISKSKDETNLVFYWRGKSKYIPIPFFHYNHFGRWILNKQEEFISTKGMSWETEKEIEFKKEFTFMNFGSANFQQCKAVATVSKREWRLHWFPFKKKVIRSMNVDFKQELGRDSGSYKGGVMGTSIDMKEVETIDECIARFCEEKNFK